MRSAARGGAGSPGGLRRAGVAALGANPWRPGLGVPANVRLLQQDNGKDLSALYNTAVRRDHAFLWHMATIRTLLDDVCALISNPPWLQLGSGLIFVRLSCGTRR
jgi:hypothetical protein